MTERINARLDPELAGKLAELRRLTGKTTTDIVRASIERYYELVREAAEPARLLTDFVGSADGDPDLASSYKQSLTKSLRRKL